MEVIFIVFPTVKMYCIALTLTEHRIWISKLL